MLADTFKIRIEMKQIGARQEAGRIGGIGPCGRPLCCASWMSNFVSVATSAARYQDISLNPQKLAGQCAKLKCCLNFEVDAYVECVKKLPAKEIRLETADNTYYYFKADIFKRLITYSTDKSVPANLVTIDAARAFEVIAMNKAGEKPLKLEPEGTVKKEKSKEFVDIIGQDSVTRFDKKNKKKSSGKNRKRAGASTDESAKTADNPNKKREKKGNQPGGDQQSQTQERRRERPPRKEKGEESADKPQRGRQGENRRNNRQRHGDKPQKASNEGKSDQPAKPAQGEN